MSTAEGETGDRYKMAEEAFLAAIRAGQDRSTLLALADAAAFRAADWNNSVAFALHSSSGEKRPELARLSERSEVLVHLWSDIAGAFRDQAALHDR